jgi:hypothetical protein
MCVLKIRPAHVSCVSWSHLQKLGARIKNMGKKHLILTKQQLKLLYINSSQFLSGSRTTQCTIAGTWGGVTVGWERKEIKGY